MIPKKSKSSWIWKVLVGATTLLFLAAAIAISVFVRKDLTPEDLREIHAAEAVIIQLSPEWHRPAPTPSFEVIEARNKIINSVTHLREKHDYVMFGDYSDSQNLMMILRRGEPVPAEKQEEFANFLQDVQLVLKEATNVVETPGYSFETGLLNFDSLIEYGYVRDLAVIASIVSLYQAQQGDCIEAMETALLLLHYIDRSAASLSITHLSAIRIAEIFSHTAYANADQCTDTLAVQHSLERMTDLYANAFPGNISHWRYGDSIGALVQAAKNGFPVNLEPRTLDSYRQQAYKIYDGTYHQWLVSNLPSGDPRVAAARDYLISDTRNYYAKNRQTKNSLVTGLQATIRRQVLGITPTSMAISEPNSSNYTERDVQALTSTSLAMYDLTRIHLARRLVELEPSATTITDYLSPVPNDPFTGAPFPFSEQLNKHYSPGPDRRDHQTAVQYDATNGTFSTGNVWMEIR